MRALLPLAIAFGLFGAFHWASARLQSRKARLRLPVSVPSRSTNSFLSEWRSPTLEDLSLSRAIERWPS